MTAEEFKKHLERLEKEYTKFFKKYAPTIAGKTAVDLFTKNFDNQGFFDEAWQEVKRRQWEYSPQNFKTLARKTKTGGKKGDHVAKRAAGKRGILTGQTGDLRRSIIHELKGDGTVLIWTNFKSKEPYGRVHNEGLKAGRGKGFTMPKRQFIGDHPQLREAIIKELERELSEITNKI